MPPAGAVQPQPAEQRSHHDGSSVFVTAREPTVRAPELGGQLGGDLILDQGALDRGQQVLGLREPQAQGVVRQGLLPLRSKHLTHDRLGLIISVHHDLHGELHATPSPR